MKRISCGAVGLPNLPKSPIRMNIAKVHYRIQLAKIPAISNRVMIVGLPGHGKAKSQLEMALEGPLGSASTDRETFEISNLQLHALPGSDEKV
jgi:hypothetical protein